MKDELLTLQSQYAELNQSLFKVVEQKYQLQLQLEEWQNDTEKLLQKLYVTKEEDTIK
jgi:phage shock protein A